MVDPPTYNLQSTIHTDVVVVGSGPGGAAVTRGLARAGRQVLLLERGSDHRGRNSYGTYLGVLRYAERGALLYSNEGMQIVRPLMLGGATSMYCGCAALPPAWLKERYHVDLDHEAAETWAELGVAELATGLRGAASTALASAGLARGYAWEPQAKLMAPPTNSPFACNATCMLGCRCGAKWNAADYVDQALAANASLLTNAHVTHVLRAGTRAIGVAARIAGQPTTIYANTVILAAGAIGTARILQASGIHGVGEGLTVDTTMLVYGILPTHGISSNPPMTWAWHNLEAGYMLSTLIDPWLMYPLAVLPSGIANLRNWANWRQIAGVMIKIKDDPVGNVAARQISKSATASDRERLMHAQQIARQLLLDIGAAPASIHTSGLRGTHPGSTAPLGRIVDMNLQTELAGLYLCDASIFPEALARPTVITIIAFAKRLVRHLTTGSNHA